MNYYLKLLNKPAPYTTDSTYPVVDVHIRVPAINLSQESVQEAAIPLCFVLCAQTHGQGYFYEDLQRGMVCGVNVIILGRIVIHARVY